MMPKEEMREKIADEIVQSFAILVSGNRQPHMSGDPTARLLPHQRRELDATAGSVADRILALMPDLALAEIGRLAVEAVKEGGRREGSWDEWMEALRKQGFAVRAYLTSDHPPRREPDPGAGTGD